jgi:two-component system KDP operon response regulator KdpE
MDGKDVIASIRQNSDVPIVVMSVRDRDDDIVTALDLGADDYIIKPFHMDVLIARVNSNLRKASIREAGEPQLVNGSLRMDLLNHEVYRCGERVTLTPKEYELLRFFMVNRGKMLMHRQILSEVWGPAHCDNMQYLRVYVGQVRSKLGDDPMNPRMIVTEPGVGYRMEMVSHLPSGENAASAMN